MSDKMREEFELEILKGELLPCNSVSRDRDDGEYSSVLTGVAWLSWQTSRAALCVELPKQWFDDGLECDLMVANRVLDALDAAGVSHK